MSFLFYSQSDSYHIGTRFAFLDCYMQSSQIRCQRRKFRSDVLLVDSKMNTSSNVLAAYFDVHPVSVVALFIGWYQSTSSKA
jgi:hypothetical protein